MTNKKPILITGAHRSGSTWVGKMLNFSKEVFYVAEPFNPKTGLKIFKDWFQYISPNNEEKYLKKIKKLLQYEGRYNFNLPALKYRTYGKLTNKRQAIKDPIACMSADWLADRFNMDVIVIVRHPAAFYNSLKRMNWHFDFNNLLSQKYLMNNYLKKFEPLMRKDNKTYAEEAGILWLCIYTVLDSYIAQNPNWIVKRHEDLSANPILEFENIYHKLGLEFTDKIKKQIEESTSSKNQTKLNSQKAIDTKRDSRGIIDMWKKDVNKQEQAIIEEITGVLAKKYNYQF